MALNLGAPVPARPGFTFTQPTFGAPAQPAPNPVALVQPAPQPAPPAPAAVLVQPAPPQPAPPAPAVLVQPAQPAPAGVLVQPAPPAAPIIIAPVAAAPSASRVTVEEVTPAAPTATAVVVNPPTPPAAAPVVEKACYTTIPRPTSQSFTVDDLLAARQFVILQVYISPDNQPKLIKVEDYLGNISFLAFDQAGAICVKRENVRPLRPIEAAAGTVSGSMKIGAVQTSLTGGVVIERGKNVTVSLKGARPEPQIANWEFTDETVGNGIYPLSSLSTVLTEPTVMVGTINDSVKHLDSIALMRAVEGVRMFNSSLDQIHTYKQLLGYIINNGKALINTDDITIRLAKLHNVTSEVYPNKVSDTAYLLQQKRLARQLFNQLLTLAEAIIRINGQLYEIANELLDIYRVLCVQTQNLCRAPTSST